MTLAFVSGPTGCIGAATVSHLLENGVSRIVGFSRRRDLSRIAPCYHDRIELVQGDICDAQEVEAAVLSAKPNRMIHLAAFQTPDCQARPLEGMDVNVCGTANMLHAAAALGDSLERFVFASSAAVYGPRSLYDGSTVETPVPYLPPNLYGYWKVAGEGMAQAFQIQTGIPTVSLRLATTYGPGRDQGLTSAPTTAIKSAVLQKRYRLPYQGREHFHYVGDVGAGFSHAALDVFDGYGVFNLRGQTVATDDFLVALRTACVRQGLPDVDVEVTENATSMPFVCDLDDRQTLVAFPRMPLTALPEGLDESVSRFQEMVREGTLTSEDVV